MHMKQAFLTHEEKILTFFSALSNETHDILWVSCVSFDKRSFTFSIDPLDFFRKKFMLMVGTTRKAIVIGAGMW